MTTQVTLSIEVPNAEPQRFALLVEGELTIGRDAACSVVLDSPDVSRQHVAVRPGPTHLIVRDQSANGTMVGDMRLHRATMRAPLDAVLGVGPYVVRVEGVAPVTGADGAPPRPAGGAVASLPPGGSEPPRPAPPAPLSPPRDAARANVGLPAGHDTALQPRRSAQPPPAAAHGNGAGATNGNGASVAGPATIAPGVLSFQAAMAAAPTVSAAATVAPGAVHAPTGADPTATPVAVRKKIHRQLLDHLDLASLDRARMDDKVMRPRVRDALKRIIGQLRAEIPPGVDLDALVNELSDEALGLGPLEHFLADPAVSEIMVVDPQTIFVEMKGKIVQTRARFTDEEAVRAVIERIVTPLGRRIDESTPLVDARLKDGSRVNAVIRPLALKGVAITIRKFAKTPLALTDLIGFGSLTEQMGRFLTRTVAVKKNVLISGGTGSGKTTLLNVLARAIPPDERIVTIEDAAELQLNQPHVVPLESRPPNMEGRGEITIRDLVRNALRMRPDRIVVGECRGGEALDMLQAMNTGHDGSLTTVHANSPREAVARLETLALMSGLDLPARAIREQIANSVHVVVQQSRFSDGSRRIASIAEVAGLSDSGEVELREIFAYHRTGTAPDGKVLGEFRATGYLPSFLDAFITSGLVTGRDYL